MVIELRVVQFWSEIILVISNQTRAARSFNFEITCMISDQIALHSVQLPLLIVPGKSSDQVITTSFQSIIGSSCSSKKYIILTGLALTTFHLPPPPSPKYLQDQQIHLHFPIFSRILLKIIILLIRCN